jgi:hypothetical protein
MPFGNRLPIVATGAIRPCRAFGAPQTICSGSSSPASTAADLQSVRVGMPLAGDDPTDDHTVEAVAQSRELIDFQTGGGQPLRGLLGRQFGIDPLGEPLVAETHCFSRGTASPALDRSAELSQETQVVIEEQSEIVDPVASIAKRSTPRPKA